MNVERMTLIVDLEYILSLPYFSYSTKYILCMGLSAFLVHY